MGEMTVGGGPSFIPASWLQSTLYVNSVGKLDCTEVNEAFQTVRISELQLERLKVASPLIMPLPRSRAVSSGDDGEQACRRT